MGLAKALEKAKNVFEAFEAAHETYLSEFDGEEDASYFDAAFDAYMAAVRGAHALLDSTKPGKSPTTSEVLVDRNLPRAEMRTFSGDPSEYHLWLSTFDELVHSAAISNSAKLTRLLQFTSGTAYEAIKYCALEKEDGYLEARKTLANQFGNAHVVTDSLISHLKNGGPVKTPSDVRQFGNDLKSCFRVLQQSETLSEVEGQSFIAQLSLRLPGYMKSRWIRQVMETKRKSGRYPDFAAFATFISQEADDANDPVYGKLHGASKQPDQRPHNEMKRAFASSAEEEHPGKKPLSCYCCQGPHRILNCKQMKDKTAEERLDFVRRSHLCFVCLCPNHVSSNCKSSYVCNVNECKQRHSHLLHDALVPCTGVKNTNTSMSTSTCVDQGTCIPIVTVRAKSRCVSAVLDTASDATFCSREFVRRLGLSGEHFSVSLCTLNGLQCADTERVKLRIFSLDGAESLWLDNVVVVDQIPVRNYDFSISSYPHLSDLNFSSGSHAVDLLIGQDNSEALIPLEVRTGGKGEPFAVRTLFGWCLNGPVRNQYAGETKISCFISMQTQGHCIENEESEGKVESMLEKMWAVENEGLSSKLQPSVHDKQVLKLWDDETKFIDGHFQLPIPWKPQVKVPNNFSIAFSRLQRLKENLQRRGLLERYDAEIQRLLDRGYAEAVNEHDHSVTFDTQKVWYLPHHLVLNPKKPDKLRVVFDCASRFEGESLNEKCFSGPDLINNLRHVLIGFRQGIFAFGGDIEAMYYQVVIPPEQRDALRFLWFDGSENVVKYRMTRHLFGGIWCSSSSTYALRKTADVFCNDLTLTSVISRSFYVDDCLHSTDSEKEMVHVALGVIDVLRKGGFRLTKFVSNSSLLRSTLPVEECVIDGKEFTSESKVLGIKWDVSRDSFHFQREVISRGPLTRRQMLRVISSVFDPLGFLTPFTVRGKLLLQNAIRLKLGWDDPVPEDLGVAWDSWLCDLKKVSEWEFPRCMKPYPAKDCACELHHFSDASEKALGCCSYLRCVNHDGSIHVSLICSRSKVAPIKKVSIPRLELEAAVMSAKTDAMLRCKLDIQLGPSYFWTDSEIVLRYIANESRRFTTFVANRIACIHDVSDPRQWKHVSGVNNVADVVSRGHPNIAECEEIWLHGPHFLRQFHSDWQIKEINASLEDDRELKRSSAFVTVTENASDSEEAPIDRLSRHYSSWPSLRKAVAWMLRLKEILKSKNSTKGPLTVDELTKSEIIILKHVQNVHYRRELDCLVHSKSLLTSSAISDLDPFLDEVGLIRVGGRLRRSPAADFCRHPILVPHKHRIAHLIVQFFHDQAHLGTEWVVSKIRAKFWITRVRPIVKSIGFKCVPCRKKFSAPQQQKMADLPPQRAQPYEPPFTFTGVDCFGPFLVKRARSELKRYGCIFVCFNTRAVHLEVLDTLETDSFINAFRRFASRRGIPREVWSDNGTNFVGAQREMVKMSVKWNFNPPHASHMGGVWERLIRIVRKVLTAVLPQGSLHGGASLNDEMIRTIFCEVEQIVNSRPITKVSDDVRDSAALTPNHFLLLNSGSLSVPAEFSDTDSHRLRWRCVQHFANLFWQKWIKEYLPDLQKRQKWQRPQRNVRVGDVVLVVREGTPRGVWPLALVMSVDEGADGRVRSCKLRLKNNAEIVRPITKCILLECSQ